MFVSRLTRLAAAVTLLLMTSNAVDAENVTLGFDSLPSAQGWTFTKSDTGSHADDNESDVFSVAANTLTMNTIGSGLVSPSGIGYTIYDVAAPAYSWTLKWRVKIVQYESSGGSDFQSGSFFAVYNGGSVVGISLSDDDVTVTDGASTKTVSNDNTNFQNFRVEYTPDTGTGTFDVFIDNNFIVNSTGRATTFNRLFIGDGTGAANSEWDMTSYNFSSIPEPSSLALLLLVGIGAAGFGRRQRRESRSQLNIVDE